MISKRIFKYPWIFCSQVLHVSSQYYLSYKKKKKKKRGGHTYIRNEISNNERKKKRNEFSSSTIIIRNAYLKSALRLFVPTIRRLGILLKSYCSLLKATREENDRARENESFLTIRGWGWGWRVWGGVTPSTDESSYKRTRER